MSPDCDADLAEVKADVKGVLTLLNGEMGRLGLVGRVEIMWRSWLWVLCTLSAAAGSGVTLAVVEIVRSI